MVRRRPPFPAHLTDAAVVGVPGPWEHRFVGAHGTRLHVAVAHPDATGRSSVASPAGPGTRPGLVLLLHGTLQNWWVWRWVLPRLAGAGYEVVAADLRGHGASDATPRGYDQPGLAADVDALVRALGHTRAVVVGHDLGAWVGWTLAHRVPERVAALVTVAAPPPSPRLLLGRGGSRRWWTALLAAQTPGLPERRLLHADGVRRWLDSGRATPVPDDELSFWVAAVRVPSVAHTVLEPARWLARASVRPDGIAWWRSVATPPPVPLLAVHGGADRLLPAPPGTHVVAGAGHQLPEEDPDGLLAVVLPWLRQVAPPDGRAGGARRTGG